MTADDVVRGARRRRPAAAIAIAALASAQLARGGGQPPAGPDPLPAISRLTKVHDYPMYLLDYQGDYRLEERLRVGDLRESGSRVSATSAWACTAFAAFGDATRPLVGRSFDWRDHAAILLRTDPSDGYASTSMVDPAYMGFGTEDITRLPASARQPLLEAPFLPFDGLNEHTSPDARPSLCSRYRTATESLAGCGGGMTAPGALALLAAVSQPHTMWSVVYELASGRVTVALGRDFSRPVVWSLTAPWPTGLIGLTGPVPGA